MKRMITALAGFGFLLFSIAGHSTRVKANYSVNASTDDPGLKIQTTEVAANPFMFDLVTGTPYTFDLFRIWTDETAVNEEDDTVLKPISVHFSFLLPEVFDGDVTGDTDGYRDPLSLLGFEIPGFYQGGELNWNAPADLFFGPQDEGHLVIALSNETFSKGIGGTLPGKLFGTTVKATVTLASEARGASAVPEPGILTLFAGGLFALGVIARRRRSLLCPSRGHAT